MDLPDELLAYIFEMTSPGLLVLKDWSLVCKKMRRITISTPRLWTYQRISLSMSPTTIEKIMRRSGTHGHDLLVKSPLVPNEALSKHCHRWSAITLDELTASEFQLFQSLAPSLKLTSLCSLSLTPPNSNAYVFNSDWRPANLKRLSCSNIIPTELPVSTLTYCFLRLERDIDIHRIATFLSSAPLLEGLHLETFERASGLGGTVVELPSLQDFSFYLGDATFLQVISMPNVTTLSVEVFCLDSMDRLWTVVKGIEGKFKHLESLDLEVTYMVFDKEEDDDLDDALYMDELLASFPDSIKCLSITIRDKILCANRDIPFGTFDDLRTVKFNNCNCLDFDFFEDLAARFKEEEILLDVLEIWNCETTFSKKCVLEEAVKVLFIDDGVLQT